MTEPHSPGAPVALPRLGVALPVDEGYSATDLTTLAVAAEDAGIDLVTVGEVAGTELFALLATLARETSRATLASAVLPVLTRPPTLAAMGFVTVRGLAGRTVVAGVGASSPEVARWHGVDVGQPVKTVREYVGVLRRALLGERVEHDGVTRSVRGFRLCHEPFGDIPVYVAAIGPAMVDLAAEIADGTFLSLGPPAVMEARIAALEAGLEGCGRDRAGFEIVVTAVPTYLAPGGPDVRNRLARYLLPYAMVPSHRPAFAGIVEDLEEVERAWQHGERERALAMFDEGVVERFCILGDAGTLAERCREYAAAGADTVVLNVTGRDGGDLDGALRTIAEIGRVLVPVAATPEPAAS